MASAGFESGDSKPAMEPGTARSHPLERNGPPLPNFAGNRAPSAHPSSLLRELLFGGGNELLELGGRAVGRLVLE